MRPVEETILLARVLYIQPPGDRQMNNAIEVSDAEQFVKGEKQSRFASQPGRQGFGDSVYGNDRYCERLLSLSRDLHASDSKQSTEAI
jgi:hypothetical protein